MRWAVLVVAVGLACAGCQQKSEPKSYSDEVTSVALIKPTGSARYEEPATAEAVAAAPAEASAAPSVSTAPTIAAGAPMLAYSYRYGLTLPASSVPDLLARHEAACTRAGFRLCQVVSSSINQVNRDVVRGELTLRATPTWLKPFRNGLAGEAKATGGRLASSRVASEDLSREIVDTEAQLRAKTTLRDRLQALLASRPGKLSDLLDVERELARVQGEIDSTQSQLAIMRGRVATSELTIDYASLGAAEPNGGWSPLAKSLRDFADIVAESLGGLVRLVAWVGPWLLVGGGLIWIFRKRLPKLRWPFGKKPPPTA